MSRLYIEGFEAGGIQPPLWNPFTTGQTASVDQPKVVIIPGGNNASKGERCLRVRPGGGDIAWLNLGHFDNNISQMYMKWRYYTNQYYSQTIMRFWSDHMDMFGYLNYLSGYFRYTGDVGYNGIPYSPATSDWHIMELWLKPSTTGAATDGEIEFRVDGVTMLSNYSARTSNQDYYPAKINKIEFYGGSYTNYAYFDDFVIDTTSSFGVNLNSSVVGYQVDSDSTKGWTAVPPAANNYPYVGYTGGAIEQDSETIDANYISTDTTGTKDIYTISQDFAPGISDGTTSVKCVQLQVRGKRYGPCPAVHLRPFLEINSTEYDGNIIRPPFTNFQSRYSIWEQNPDTSTDWIVSDIDNMKIGVEST